MKKITLIVAALFVMSNMYAQRKKKLDAESGFVTCSEFHITKPLREICAENPIDETKQTKPKESEDRENNIPQQFKFTAEKDGPAYGNDLKTMQTTMGTVRNGNRVPIHNWAGQANGNYFPLDPDGAVGPNNYVQMINATTFKIWNKTGTVQLTGTLGNLWTPHLAANDGDPVVLYDKAADRWFMSQFGVTGNKIYIAVSTSGDPTGTWYTYTFTATAFPDYLKFGVWQDGYYMTGNLGPNQKVYVFERAAMLAGNAGAHMVYHAFSPPRVGGWFMVPLPGDCGDDSLPPAGTPCPIFSYSDNGWGSNFIDAINIYNVTVDWTPATPTETIVAANPVPTAPFDASYVSSWDDIAQPGTTQKLDGLGGCLMFRAQYKTWATYNSVVLNWAVKISSTQRSIKWCELRRYDTTSTWTMYQEGIYTPDSDTRWMGSIAMDSRGSIALCYMKDNATNTYPGLYYTGRRVCDPLGTLPVTEVLAQAGAGSQTAGTNRDGDYSETYLDPDGITFWHTGMFMGASGSQQTRVYSFQITPCVVTAKPIAAFAGSHTSICIGDSVTFSDLSTNAPTSWHWTFHGGNIASSTQQSPTVVFDTLGTYPVKFVATNAFGSDSVTMTNYISVVAIPAAPIITHNGSTLSSNIATSNQWYLNGVPIPGTLSTHSVFAFTQNGTYTDIRTIGGCPSAASNSITIVDAGITTLSEDNTLLIYPNPSDGQFTVSFTAYTKQSYKLKLFNALGQLVYTKDLLDVSGTISQQIDVSTYPKGIYMLSLTDSQNQTVKKIMVY